MNRSKGSKLSLLLLIPALCAAVVPFFISNQKDSEVSADKNVNLRGEISLKEEERQQYFVDNESGTNEGTDSGTEHPESEKNTKNTATSGKKDKKTDSAFAEEDSSAENNEKKEDAFTDTTELTRSNISEIVVSDTELPDIAAGINVKNVQADLPSHKRASQSNTLNNLVSDITHSSRIYLPDSYGKNAVIVSFGVMMTDSVIPWHKVILEPTDPKTLNTEKQEQSMLQRLSEMLSSGKSISEEAVRMTLNKTVDSLSGPTRLALHPVEYEDENGKHLKEQIITGNGPKYVADLLSEETGAEVFEIETASEYPQEEIELYRYTLKEKTENVLPELIDDNLIDFNNKDTIYLCLPIWWQDYPRAVYSFLERFDFSNKVIIPICISNEDSCDNYTDILSALEPHAQIREVTEIKQKELQSLNLRNKLRTLLEKLAEK